MVEDVDLINRVRLRCVCLCQASGDGKIIQTIKQTCEGQTREGGEEAQSSPGDRR
jgi:hypothetical protein